MADRLARLGDFTDQAQLYAGARPGYPDNLIDRLIEYAAIGHGDPVADLGAGTGILTGQLAQRGLAVTAVEPNEAMRAQAGDITGATWTAGTFEQTNLPDRSQAWVTAAQAFHWADHARTLPELRRILQPAGQLTVMWNNRLNDQEPLLAEAWAIIRQHVPDFDDNYRDNRDWPAILTATGDFEAVRHDEATHIVPMSCQRFVNLWASHNRLLNAAGPQRFAKLLAEIGRCLDQAGATEVRVPYRCRAWTVRRT